MLIVIATAKVDPANRARMEEVGAAMVTASRLEAGCLGYSYAWDYLEPDTMRATELWRDAAALRFHFATPHMAAFLRALKEMGTRRRRSRSMRPATRIRSGGMGGRRRLRRTRPPLPGRSAGLSPPRMRAGATSGAADGSRDRCGVGGEGADISPTSHDRS